MAHSPDVKVTDDDMVVTEDYKEMYQASVHIAKYHKAWIRKQKNDEDSKFNLSATIRKSLDRIIRESDVEIPEEALIEREEFEDETGIAVFITED